MGQRRSLVRIVTDTTACVPESYAREHAVEVVPQVILFGEQSYLEDVEISAEEFIRRLKTCVELPKTAAPPPGEFVKAYARQLEAADAVISIHPSTEVSGTVRSALTAKAESFPQADIRVLDTRTVAGNLASMVMAAVGWAEAGACADEILTCLRAMIPRARTYFLVSTLEYLQRGGRLGGASALIGSVLQIKPILELKDGRVEVLEKVRTQRRAMERLRDLALEQCPRTPEAHLSVMHADDLAAAEAFVTELGQALGMDRIPIYGVGAAITTHAGPGTVAVGFFV
jgi:DegV family protein with EDD domain